MKERVIALTQMQEILHAGIIDDWKWWSYHKTVIVAFIRIEFLPHFFEADRAQNFFPHRELSAPLTKTQFWKRSYWMKFENFPRSRRWIFVVLAWFFLRDRYSRLRSTENVRELSLEVILSIRKKVTNIFLTRVWSYSFKVIDEAAWEVSFYTRWCWFLVRSTVRFFL